MESKTTTNEQTLGEKRVRTAFNPGNNDTVQNLKEHFAHLINNVDKLKSYKVPGDVPTTDGEKLRLISLSQTALEEAAMWAVKAATM